MSETEAESEPEPEARSESDPKSSPSAEPLPANVSEPAGLGGKLHYWALGGLGLFYGLGLVIQLITAPSR